MSVPELPSQLLDDSKQEKADKIGALEIDAPENSSKENIKLNKVQPGGDNTTTNRRAGYEKSYSKTNMPEELRNDAEKKKYMGKESIRKRLITKDSFVDDFSFRRIKRSLSSTYAEAKKDKEAALKKAGGSKQKDAKIKKDAKNLLWGLLFRHWPWLLLGFPFMFLGSVIEFLAPNYIGKMLDQFRLENFEGEDGVYDILKLWIAWTVFSGLCSAARDLIFGITSQKIGLAMRGRLFKAIIEKDVNFYDNIRTGELLSRLGSDTQVV